MSAKVDVQPEERNKETAIITVGKKESSVVEEENAGCKKHQKKRWWARLKLAGIS